MSNDEIEKAAVVLQVNFCFILIRICFMSQIFVVSF